MRSPGLASFGLLTVVASGAALGACSEDGRAPAAWAPDTSTNLGTVDIDPCARPNTGCTCAAEGEVVECGSIVSRHDDYVTCSSGTRTCSEGVWGECLGSRRTQEVPEASSGGLRIMAAVQSAVCPTGFDPCDPYCNQVVDSPIGVTDPGDGFETNSGGLTLVRTSSATPCTSLTITPAASQIEVTALSPLAATPNPLALSVTASPETCMSGEFATTWAVDKVDRASIAGTNSSDGSLTIASPIGGTLRVSAFALGLSTSINIPVAVTITDNAAALATAPANKSPAAYAAAFVGAGATASTVSWLYPYEDTYFPLGLQAPVVQYTAGNAKAVKVSLRYPSGKALGDDGILFNYSFVVAESNVVSAAAGVTANGLDPQIVIPQAAWKAFERSARGGDADIVIQRIGTTGLENESRRRIHFVDGQLKGTVYYNSYNSTIGGSTSTNVFGAVLKIRPEDAQPESAVPYVSGTNPDGLKTNGVCTVCHSVSSDGSTLAFMSGYTNGAGCYNSYSSSGNYRGNACSFTLDASGSVDWISTYRSDVTTQKYRFTWGAPYPDGSFFLTNAWDNTESYESNSGLARTSDAAALTASGVPALAVTPSFSHDGRAVAYNDGIDGRVLISEFSPCKQANGTSAGEFVEIRNDALGTVDIGGWTIKRSNGTTCFTVANGTTLARGKALATPLQSGADCLAMSDTVALHDSSGELRHSYAYNFGSTCRRAILSCPTASWTQSTTLAEVGTNDSCTLTDTNDISTSKLKVRDFACGASPGSVGCAAASSKVFSNERTVVDCSSAGCVTAGNPSFLPDARGLLYQHVKTAPATSAAYGGSTGVVSRLNTWQGAQAEIWLTSSDQSPGWSPKRLLALNGLTSAGVNYLPLEPRSGSVPTGYDNKFHDGSLGASGWVYDRCSTNSPLIAATVNENQLNYVPTVAPQEAGGKYWVIFTSRRLYGNVATSSPWQAERSNNSSNLFGPFSSATSSCDGLDQYSPGSGLIETKKLWIAAVDKDWETSGGDPSHPAFYLPGQELEAGNSHGYWVADACADLGATCETSDDCCNGTGDAATRQCKVVSTATVPATKQCTEISDCSMAGEACSTSEDCCDDTLTCPTGGGVCVYLPPVAYEHQQLTREYEASCPEGTQVEWRFFEWQATIPEDTHIDFSIQARASASGTAVPAAPEPMSSALPSTDPNASEIWYRGASTAGDILSASAPELLHAPFLIVTMDFYPSEDGQVAPTLHGWQQMFDCTPAR